MNENTPASPEPTPSPATPAPEKPANVAPSAADKPAPVAPPAATPPPPPAKPTLRLAAKPGDAPKPMTSQQVEGAVKMPGYAGKFASPMPKLDKTDEQTPGWQAALAALAAVVAIGSAVLLYLKR